MDDLNFTEEEIREQLEKLGYADVPSSRLAEFKRDLERLVAHERSKNSSWSTCSETISNESHEISRRSHLDPVGRLNRLTHVNREPSCYAKDNVVYDHSGHQSIVSKSRVPGHDPFSHLVYIPHGQVDDSRTEHDDTIDSTSTTSERKLIKRRVLRKKDGQRQITDELTESEADDLSYIGDRLGDLQLDREPVNGEGRPGQNHPSHFDPYGHHYAVQRPSSAPADKKGRFGLPENYDGPTALIRPMSGDPHTRHLRKADPVSRYQKYRQSWQLQNAPGEKNHKNLRWNVREQMLYHDQVVQKKSHKVYVPNSYIIPSDKKRKSLRWNVRQDLAQGVIPPSIYE